METFSDAAKSLSGSPLGIIALFIVLLYAFASLVTTFSSAFSAAERIPLIYFLVIFPFVVLGVFAWLVSQHATSLYAPKDFKNEDNYIRTVALLAAAQARGPGANDSRVVDVNAIIATVDRSAQSNAKRVSQRKQLLWVDDHPDNNVLEKRAFESAGFEITLALNTQQALNLIGARDFSAVISDMGRAEGPREGYVLLEQIRSRGIKLPYFVYSSSSLAEHKREALENGAQGATSDPNELFRLVTAAAQVNS
ncbi:response regulator [Bradyrhizobium sp. LMG 9283]|uniref:response regulator n=1 Tax=Bradyrhizobium sp. LMG 9283 TaxID=592064 RepID=UPI00388FDA17